MQPQENRTIDCKALQDLIPEYAFGLTDSEQARWVESNLPFCPDAATQLAERLAAAVTSDPLDRHQLPRCPSRNAPLPHIREVIRYS